MSACSCSCGWNEEYTGSCVMRNRVARTIPKRGNICPNCNTPVEIGQRCIDYAGVFDGESGWFNRFHEECFLLMEMFADKVCGGEWCYPFDADDASRHAVAHADDPYWRTWLDLYERTWCFTPEPKEDGR